MTTPIIWPLSKSFAEGKGFDNPALPEPHQKFDSFPTAFPLFLTVYWLLLSPHLLLLKLFLAAV